MSRTVLLLLVAFLLPAQTLDIGPRVGEAFPDFRLKDQYGTARDLRSILGPKGAVVVLYRSADW
jgi:hypothetical protein